VGVDAERRRAVRKVGLEPTRPGAQEPKSCVSANSTTPASAFSLLRDLSSGWGLAPVVQRLMPKRKYEAGPIQLTRRAGTHAGLGPRTSSAGRCARTHAARKANA